MKQSDIDPLVAALAIACLVTAGIASCTEAKADTVFGVHTVSAHFPKVDGQNNVNPGAYIRFENGVTLGGYYNTLGRASFYAAYTTPQWGPFALTVGAISGYQKKVSIRIEPCTPGATDCYQKWVGTKGSSPGAITAMLAPSVVLPSVFDITPRISVVPRVGTSSTVVHLSLERSF